MIAALLALMLGQTPPRDSRAVATAAASATIAGVVVTDEAQPRPLRGARVMVNGNGLPTTRSAISGNDGTFRIAVPAGALEVSVAKEAYVPAGARSDRAGQGGMPIGLAPGETKRITIRMSRGAVITGAVLDVDGQPAQGITVAALARRFNAVLGEERFTPVPMPVLPTDDRGIYRIYGLAPGEYLVAARPTEPGSATSARPAAMMTQGVPGRRRLAQTQIFHPSSTDLTRAERVVVRAGEERGGIDVQLQYVAVSSISGIAATTPGWTRADVALVRVAGVQGSATDQTAYADETGRFSFANVPAGQYRIGARSIGPLGEQSMAVADLTVDGEDADNVVLPLQPALRINGLLVFRGDTAPPVFGKSTSTPAPLTLLLNGYARPAPLQIDGVRFWIDGLIPGRFRMGSLPTGLRASIGGWWLQSVVANGVELLDAPIDLTQTVEGAVATYSDRASEVSGRVTTADGAPVSGITVIAFSVDRASWFAGSRRVWGVLSDRDGRYVIRNLPSGDYRLATASGVQTFEWFDSTLLEELLPAATPLTLADREKKPVDLRVR